MLPFLLRRLKEDVLHDLPPKIIQDYYCELSDLQKELYDNFAKSKMGAAAEETFHSGEDVDRANPKQQHVFQSLQYLRKLCNHPALVLKDEASTAAALSTANLPADGLKDIQNAPKLLALKSVVFPLFWYSVADDALGNFCSTVVSARLLVLQRTLTRAS